MAPHQREQSENSLRPRLVSRDAFLGLMHTYRKLGTASWDYLRDRLRTPQHLAVPYLPDLNA